MNLIGRNTTIAIFTYFTIEQKLHLKPIRRESIWFMEEFHNSGKFSKRDSHFLVRLTPKVNNQRGLREYKLISLIGYVYKVVTKYLGGKEIIDDVKRNRK